MSDTEDQQFSPYNERDSVKVEADEVPADSFDPAAADFEREPSQDDECGGGA
jgi:hypothetical protein